MNGGGGCDRAVAAGIATTLAVDVYVKCKCNVKSHMNLLERELHYPLGDTLPSPGAALEVAPGVRWLRMALPFALDHINLWLLRDKIDGVEGWTVVDCCIDDAATRAVGADLRDAAAGPADPARDRHAHAPRPHRLGRLAVRALERAAVDQRDRLPRRARARAAPATGSAAALSAAFFASHGLAPTRKRSPRSRPRSNYYANMVPAVPESLRAHARTATGASDRRSRGDGAASRLRPRARAHGAVLRRSAAR